MAIFDWQLNKYQLHTYLELNDMDLVDLSVWQIITIKDELNHDVNTFSKGKSKTCGSKMSLRYSYGRYLRNAHRNARAEARFISHARNHGFTGKFHRYLLTVNPKLFSAYEPITHDERKQMSTARAFRGLRHDLTARNEQTLHKLSKINASEVTLLRRNPKIAVIDMGVGRPYEAVHGSVRLMYHLHYSLLTTGRINKRSIARTAKAGHNWSVKLTDHGKTNKPSGNDYVAKQDVNGTGNATDDSRSDYFRRKKSRQTRLFISSFHRCPIALAEAMTCYYYDHTVQNRLYWNVTNDQVKSYRHFCKCYEWLLNTIATLDFNWVNDCTRNKQSQADYARATKALADYRKMTRYITTTVALISVLGRPQYQQTDLFNNDWTRAERAIHHYYQANPKQLSLFDDVPAKHQERAIEEKDRSNHPLEYDHVLDVNFELADVMNEAPAKSVMKQINGNATDVGRTFRAKRFGQPNYDSS